MLIFEEGYPYMNNFHFPVKRDVKSAISLFSPKKNEIVSSLTLLGTLKDNLAYSQRSQRGGEYVLTFVRVNALKGCLGLFYGRDHGGRQEYEQFGPLSRLYLCLE